MDKPMTRRDRIFRTLTEALEPSRLEVIDESHLHAGHAGARPEGETHYRVRIAARRFAGASRLERHRIINGLLADELSGGLHALAIEADAPEG
jgi:BolA protein